MQFLKKNQKTDVKRIEKNWYADRYQSVVVQRNFLGLITLVALGGIIISVFTVVQVTTSKSIEPFVIEVEDKTGIPTVIRPLIREQYAYDETLRLYFLHMYMNARETYDPVNYEYNYFTVVRLLSTAPVYGEFKSSIDLSNPKSPMRLGKNGKQSFRIKSVTPLKTGQDQKGFIVQIRFVTVQNTDGVEHPKLATMNFDYMDMNLTKEERAINPLGFQVLGYRVDDETL